MLTAPFFRDKRALLVEALEWGWSDYGRRLFEGSDAAAADVAAAGDADSPDADADAAADVADADAVAAASPLTPAAELARIATYRPDLHAVLATNPSTYPGLVDWLRQSEDPEVQAALAARFAHPGAAPAPPPPPAAASAPPPPATASAPVAASAPSSLPALPPALTS